MNPTLIVKELRNIQAHSALTQHWAGELIKKIEGEGKKERKVKGLTEADRARIRARLMKVMLKK